LSNSFSTRATHESDSREPQTTAEILPSMRRFPRDPDTAAADPSAGFRLDSQRSALYREHEATEAKPYVLAPDSRFDEFTVTGRSHQMITAAEQEARRLLEQALANAEAETARLYQEARDTVAKAREQAQAIVEEGEQTLEALKQQAYEEGVQAGIEQGLLAGRQQATELTLPYLQAFRALLEESFELKHTSLKHFRAEAMGIVLFTLEQLVNVQLEADAYPLVEYLVEQAIASLHLSQKIRVVVHPRLMEQLLDHDGAITEEVSLLQRIQFETDPLLLPSQVYILSAEGRYDISPLKQIEQWLQAAETDMVLPEPLAQAMQNTEDLPDLQALNEAIAEEEALYVMGLTTGEDTPTTKRPLDA
jgi:flagellar biosynthesis/type III secretory pathway protein FliH